MIQKRFAKDVRKRKNRVLLNPARSAGAKNMEYHNKNKEKNNERRMNHYWNNRDQAREYARKYKQEHREEINAKARERRAKNYEEEYAKIKWMTCPVCNNYPIQSNNYKRHLGTALHQENLKKIEG